MLKQRIITALVLLAFALPALLSRDPLWLGYFGLVLILAAAWEWGRLNGLGALPAVGMSIVCLAICSLLWAAGMAGHLEQIHWLLIGGIWILAGANLLKNGSSKWQHWPVLLRLTIGVLVLCCTWLALFQAKLMGTTFLLSILTLVWVADIAAYFVGRRWGRTKLAIHISPGKSWEGVAGGMMAVLLFALLWVGLENQWPMLSGSVFGLLLMHGWPMLIVGAVFLTAMSVMGDLIESLIKRSAGAKDSSQLLPGHGGVLDRIDALLPTLPLAVMLSLF